MPLFAYKARNARGEQVQGVLEASDSNGIASQLFNAGITPIDISPTSNPITASGTANNWWVRLNEEKVRSIDVQLFSRQLYTLIKSGIPIMRALAGLQESATNTSFARILKDLRESLDAGRELSAALRRHPHVFSNFYVNMVRVGEMTGRLEEVFLRLFAHLDFEREMSEKVRTAMRYPSFVAMAMLGAMIVINIFVIPAFANVYAGFHATLPLPTRFLMATSAFSIQYWPLLLASAILAVFAVKVYLATVRGRYKWDRLKLRVPIMGPILLKATLARFARSFSLSSRSGVPIVLGLTVVSQTVDNTYIASRVEQMRDGVERGENILRTATVSDIFTPVVLQMIAVGEETGELDDLMDEIARMYEHEVDYQLKTLSSQIEPILIGVLGIMVLILALGIFLPMWDLGRTVIHN